MTSSPRPGEAFILVGLRLSLGWIFLWASIHHYGNHAYIDSFLDHTKTFHGVYDRLAFPAASPVLSFGIEYGQILIALSLILGMFFRLGAIFGAILLLVYWTADMDFPYINSADNFIVDEHVIFALALLLLMARQAGRVWGADRYLSGLPVVRRSALLRWCVG